jgi:hypothetical protein
MLCHYDHQKKIADYEVFPMGFFSKTPKMSGYPAAPGASMGMPSPYPLGHAPPHVRQHAAMMMKGVMRDLNSLKQAGMLSPQHMMIERWCDTLGRLVSKQTRIDRTMVTEVLFLVCRALEPMTIIAGPMKGLMDWMMEVQFRRYRLVDAGTELQLNVLPVGILDRYSHSEDQGTRLRSEYPTEPLRENSYRKSCG